MKLKCKINEKIYDIVQGCSFTDNYEETLDSGTIILSQIPKIEDLDPYDDVFIWDSEKFDFDGFQNYEIIIHPAATNENDYKNDFQVHDNQDTTFEIYVNANTISQIIETISNENSKKETKINFYTIIGNSPLIPEIVGLPISMSFSASVIDGKLTLKNETYPNGTVTLSNTDLTVETTFFVPKEIIFSMDKGGGYYCYSQIIETEGPDQNYMSELGFDKFYIKEVIPESKIKKYKKTIYNGFYKHMLIDQFSYEMLNTVDFKTGKGVHDIEPLYNYTIQLFSEIKAMEKIILPNISVTQSLNVNKKKTIYQYICDFLEMYSPKIKVVDDAKNKTWKYEQKYHIGEEMKEIFDYNYPQDFTLNTPTLRELITTLMKTKNMIPYVTDNLVYGLDITQRTGEFNLNLGDINFITGSKTSDNYANTLRTEYQQALSSKSTCRSVEYVGLRNSSESLMTLDNMRLELSYPIYKINSVKLCYFNKAEISDIERPESTKNYGYNLIEQDITPLILLDSIRNMLPDDWESVDEELYDLQSLDQLSKLKFCTIGYSQGSNYISGWGQRYTYFQKVFLKWYEPQKTVIENILAAVQSIHPQGNVVSIEEIYKNFNENMILLRNNEHISPFSAKSENFAEGILTRLFQSASQSSMPLFFKSLLFKVDYEAYYNGTIVHSKAQDNKDDICSTDNQASSLALLEEDGLAKIEKLNRFGNVGYQIMGRYTNKFYNYDYIQPLGSVLNIHSDNDIVIYSREYSIWDNEIVVRYSGMKDHVLKNFYTSVFAKYRLYNVMGTDESVQRNENIYTLTLLSKDEQYYESEIQQYYSTSMLDYINRTVVAAFEPNVYITEDKEELVVNKNSELNICYIEINGAKYACDFFRVVSGHTLSFNFKMFDNASMGVYISVPSPFSELKSEDVGKFFDWQVTNDYTGSKQQWYMTVDDEETGFTKDMTFCVGTVDYGERFNNDIKIVGENDTIKKTIKDKYENSIFTMPKVNYSSEQPFVKISKRINKDNKETINMTIENELLSKNDDIIVSNYLLHLSNIDNHKYIKNDDKDLSYYNNYLAQEYNISSLIYALDSSQKHSYYSVIEISKEIYKKGFIKGRKLSGKIGNINQAVSVTGGSYNYVRIAGWEFAFEAIDEVTDDYFDVSGSQTVYMRDNASSNYYYRTTKEVIRFRKTSTLGSTGRNEYGIEDYYGSQSGYYHCHQKNIYGYETFLYYGRRIKVGNLITTGWEVGSGHYHFLQDDQCSTSPFTLLRNEGTMEFNTFNRPPDSPRTSSMLLKPGKDSGLVKDQTVIKTMFIRLSDSNMSKTIEYEEYKQNEITMSDLKVSDIIKFKQDPEKDNPYIYIDLSNINNLDNIKSVQYWYWDTNTSSYHFVFGVNITDEDKIKKYIKVYISVLTKKDTRVYDKKHNVVGNSLNYVKSTKKFGKEQYYE